MRGFGELINTRAGRAGATALAVAAGWGALRLASPRGALPPEPNLSATSSPQAVPTRPGQTPIDNGGHYLCPPVAPLAAYVTPRRYYPPNHPAPPPDTIRPARCFATNVEADVQGYAQVPPPAGDLYVGGIYLVPAPPALAGSCDAAAHDLRLTVPCPTVLPEPFSGDPLPSCGNGINTIALGCLADHAFVFGEANFKAPAGSSISSDSLFVIAFRTSRPPPLEAGLGCPARETIVPDSVGSSPALFFICRGRGAFYLDGDTVLAWTQGAFTFEVAIHSDSPLYQPLLLEIANDVRYLTG